MCRCIEKMDKQLQQQEWTDNTRLDSCFRFNFAARRQIMSVRIATVKRDSTSRKKAVTVFPSFCPFCGEKITFDECAKKGLEGEQGVTP